MFPTDDLVDVRIMAWMLTPNSPAVADSPHVKPSKVHPLDVLLQHCDAKAAQESAAALLPLAGSTLNARELAVCRRALQSHAMFALLHPKLQKMRLLEPLANIEMPLVRVLAAMEHHGVGVDRDALAQHKVFHNHCKAATFPPPKIIVCSSMQMPIKRRMNQLQQQVSECGGKWVVMNSHIDIANLVWNRLEIVPPPSVQRLESGHFSTKAEVFRLQHKSVDRHCQHVPADAGMDMHRCCKRCSTSMRHWA